MKEKISTPPGEEPLFPGYPARRIVTTLTELPAADKIFKVSNILH
jgi:hypothetical protein